MVNEQAAGLVFEEGDAPAVCMVIGDAAARRKAGERERDVRRRGAVHSKKLAHVAKAERLNGGTRYNDDFPSISPSQARQIANLTGVQAATLRFAHVNAAGAPGS